MENTKRILLTLVIPAAIMTAVIIGIWNATTSQVEEPEVVTVKYQGKKNPLPTVQVVEVPVLEELHKEQTDAEPVEAAPKKVISKKEYDLLCRVCMSETGGKYGELIEGKVAVVETILNRVDAGWGTIEQVVTKKNQYSMADNGEPDESVKAAVDQALEKRVHPRNMYYFRTSYYHKFGKPYKKIGNHYFSLEG